MFAHGSRHTPVTHPAGLGLRRGVERRARRVRLEQVRPRTGL